MCLETGSDQLSVYRGIDSVYSVTISRSESFLGTAVIIPISSSASWTDSFI